VRNCVCHKDIVCGPVSGKWHCMWDCVCYKDIVCGTVCVIMI